MSTTVVPSDLSVIIPTFARNAPLVRCLRQWMEQTPAPEIIVVDQRPAHDSETEMFLNSLRGRVRYITSDTPNLPAARNLGIQHSSREIVVFCDDDVIIPEGVVASLLRRFADPKIQAVTGRIIFKDLKNGEVLSVSHAGAGRFSQGIVEVRDFIGGFMAFRREVFDRAGRFDEWMGAQPTSAGEDFEFSMRLRAARIGLFLDPALEFVHESRLEGGCRKTEVAAAERSWLSYRMAFYAYLKNPMYPGPIGRLHSLWRCYRAAVLNRSILSLDPRRHFACHRLFFRALRFAMDALRENSNYSRPKSAEAQAR